MGSTLNPRMDETRETRLGSLHAIPQTTSQAAVCWPAVMVGALVAAAVTMILLLLGTGLGFASISPWPAHAVSAAVYGMSICS
jgi:hypothetical protein